MSYIRCLSNPEQLYVYHNCNGQVDFWVADKLYTMPFKTFSGLMESAIKEFSWRHKAKCGSAKIYVNKHYKIVIGYKKWKIEMFEVTFHYILNQFQFKEQYGFK